MGRIAVTWLFLLAGAVSAYGGDRQSAWGPELDSAAPALDPEMLVVARFGGPGDQGFTDVQVRRGTVAATAGTAFRVIVTCGGDEPRVRVSGNLVRHQPDLKGGIPAFKRKQLGPFAYGYKQVHSILQQPYITGPGWTWWDWSHGPCKERSLMADSRCTFLATMPNGHLFAMGKCDGGNTTLHRDPRDLDEKLKFHIKEGGGKGTSSFCYEIDPTSGEPVRQMVLRGFANAVCWDRWGRVMVVGWGITQHSEGEPFGYPDGAGILVADREWREALLKAHVGPGGVFHACAIDSATGLAAAAGFTDKDDLEQLHGPQTRPGGGKDAFLVVFRLWGPPEKDGGETEGTGTRGRRGTGNSAPRLPY